MIRMLLMNILLTFIWVALTGQVIVINFIIGFVISFHMLWFIRDRNIRNDQYFYKLPQLIVFILYFIKELVKANFEVAVMVVKPKFTFKPGIVAVPLSAKSDMEITLLANLITLTPGTLSLDVSDDKKVLYVHAMNIDDKEEFKASIKDGFEKRIIKLFK